MTNKPRVKPRRLKIWPEVESLAPIMLYLPPIAKSGRVIVELSNCNSADSCGLNVLLMRLIKQAMSSNVEGKLCDLVEPISPEIKKIIFDSGFIHYLNKWFGFDRQFTGTLLELCYQYTQPKMSDVIEIETATGITQYSYPIYMFNFDGENRRGEWNQFQNWTLTILNTFENYNIPKFELLSIIKEVFKNSADHTDNIASFAIDIRQNRCNPQSAIEISFTFLDLGKGIYKNIYDILAASSIGRIGHGSLTEVYHMAMQRGFSTKSSKTKINLGLGMDVITRGSKSIGMHLSVYDAQSRGVLSGLKEVTHSEIRKHFFDSKNQVVFCYYGKLTCGAKL